METVAPLQGADQTASEVLRVLLVDDHAPILLFLLKAFNENGCRATTASTAEQALELLSRDAFDLVVSDITMPGLSGLDLLRVIKGQRPGTPVVLITGKPSVDSATFGLRHGAYDYLPKPFRVTVIKQLIQRVRQDRARGNGSVSLPAGLAEDLERRLGGVEVLSAITALALQGLEAGLFIEKVLEKTMENLRCDGAVILLRDQEGRFSASRRGEPALVQRLLGLLHARIDDVLRTDGRRTFTLTEAGQEFEALSALISGVSGATGILCMTRDARRGGFLPDEKALLLGYAQTTSVALQRIELREQLEQNLVATITSYVIALEKNDPYLRGHSTRVSLYTGAIAGAMGMGVADVHQFCRAGMLHDLGKVGDLGPLLRAPRALSEAEFERIRRHPEHGDDILKQFRFLACEAKAVRHHHERYDGTGYPDGLRGEEIPLIARVVTVADSFDAMTSDRPYRARRPIIVAREEVARCAKSQFDPLVAEAFATIPVARLEEISQRFDLDPEGPTGALARPLVAP